MTFDYIFILQFTVISIHTPTQGVTARVVSIHSRAKISIHTPTQGVTWYRDELPETKHISIHTPRVVSETH